ncbi:MAG: ATP synthase F0 subunit C [Elusimicrobia bacterium]|nr:ATP synthase F0 subunit C [Elusimicrobiota bacterium]
MENLTYLGLGYIGAGLGAGITLIGAGFGIGKLAASALEGTARQPEAAGSLRTSMIIASAFIEGLGFLSLVICLLVAINIGLPKEKTGGERTAQVETHK